MKVRKLIEMLKEMPQDAEVVAYSEEEIISFELEHVREHENKVYIGYIYEDYPISLAEFDTEYNNSKGKLKAFWYHIQYNGGFYHNNVNGKRISIDMSSLTTLTGETVSFIIEENGKAYCPTDFAEVKAFVEKYIDFLMEGVDYNPKDFE